MRSRLSSIAFLIGLFAVVLAAFEGNFVPPTRPDPVLEKMSLKEAATLAAKRVIQEKILHKTKPSLVSRIPLHPYQMVYTAFGLLAIGLGIYSWTQKAHPRLAAGAVALGIMAVAWQ